MPFPKPYRARRGSAVHQDSGHQTARQAQYVLDNSREKHQEEVKTTPSSAALGSPITVAMAWEHLEVNRPHLVYIILGGFTSLFMLCSSVFKERFYIGEATVATICGIIFGPLAANLINPDDWGNTDQITLEFCRIVLVVQCFAVGVELPKSYMEKHWKSVTMLLIPVMTFGWLMTSLFVWWLFRSHLNWLDSLAIAACVTATDPVLASSVVGKGKFAKRVPKHLRDLLSAESGCNDGMAFPFIYLAIYTIRYKHEPSHLALHWFCYTILYECVFGAIFGVVIGYAARRAIRLAHERDLIDRESFLVFYFVLALFCAGSGSILGMDDLLIGFACGVGFSNDGWFQEKTEEAHVSNVIDLLINLAFFVYFGTIIPWSQYSSAVIGTSAWRLVVLAIFVLLFRRIPIMMMLKPVIPDIKTWREALFAGHFGPIGVGALFVAILARAELETESTTPLAKLPEPGFEHMNIIELIWPITSFLVICSIVVHGSSIAVFTLGKHINTLTLTFSYTQGVEEGPNWMDRLPRIQSRSKSSMSMRRPEDTESSMDEKPEGAFSLPTDFLRRQKEPEQGGSRPSSVRPHRRKKWDAGIGPGGPISQSAIAPQPRNLDHSDVPDSHPTDSETLAVHSEEMQGGGERRTSAVAQEAYLEGSQLVLEDSDGNVLAVRDMNADEPAKERERHAKKESKKAASSNLVDEAENKEKEAEESDSVPQLKAPEAPASAWRNMQKRMESFSGLRKHEDNTAGPSNKGQRKRGPALAYQFGNTIIVEDEDGEVLKKYDIPATNRPGPARPGSFADPTRALQRMGTWVGLGGEAQGKDATATAAEPKREEDDDDHRIRFKAGGRRMSKAEFIEQIQTLDPKARARAIAASDAPEAVKREAVVETGAAIAKPAPAHATASSSSSDAGRPISPEGLATTESATDIPFHPIGQTLANFSMEGRGETAAQRRRREAATSIGPTSDEDDERPGRAAERPAVSQRRLSPKTAPASGSFSVGTSAGKQPANFLEEGETMAERRRRQAALGLSKDDDSSSSDEEDGASGFREPRVRSRDGAQPAQGASSAAQGARTSIRFADTETPRLRWGEDVGRKK
ncbi:hypothetical protein EJ06DRAFT_174476 [Trichodelitschia bisporula]|uniref:Na+/H+ antiporter n=1 Tax=Trichodelitschia bisporula TaxID=703511 RepID=A0A6G1HM03_9PEZI|nr:hypothetical protein EJ06DRAFT_174476 [Trichodelitschia bisporula]